MAETENWQFNKSALECHKYMLEQGICTDVTFEVCNKVYGLDTMGEEGSNIAETFQAHKYQLICRSPVFHAMLCGDLAEKGKIVVDDMDPKAFKEMLNYIYTDKVDMKPELAMHILYASKKYLLPGLTKLCVEYLEKDLSDKNACILYDHSLLFDETELSERSLLKIKNQTKNCLKAPSMQFIRQSTLSKILDSDRLTAPEVDVYSGCETWAKHQVKESGQEITGEAMRKVLGDCVYKIRYPVLKFEEFGTIVAPTGILLADEEISIFRYFASKGNTSVMQQFQCQNRFLTGPFTVTYEGNCAEISTQQCTTKFDITCDQTISVKYLTIGEMKYGTTTRRVNVHFTCSDVRLDDTIYKVRSLQVGNPCKLYLEKDMVFHKNSKIALEISFKVNPAQSLSEYPTLKHATSRDVKFVNSQTGLNVSVSASNHMFLLGFTYDYNYM